jgi:hypothetical protein
MKEWPTTRERTIAQALRLTRHRNALRLAIARARREGRVADERALRAELDDEEHALTGP